MGVRLDHEVAAASNDERRARPRPTFSVVSMAYAMGKLNAGGFYGFCSWPVKRRAIVRGSLSMVTSGRKFSVCRRVSASLYFSSTLIYLSRPNYNAGTALEHALF